MLRRFISLTLLTAILSVPVANASIPEPDVVLYGTVRIGGFEVTVFDNVDVFATHGSASDTPLGSYHLGDIPEAGDQYVLRIRLESLADGSAPSASAARIGDTVNIYGTIFSGPAELLATYEIVDRAIVRAYNLPFTCGGTADFDCDGDIDLTDFNHLASCMTGPEVPQDEPSCADAKLDLDTDVDLVDFYLFQKCFSGAGNAPDASCTN
jgi:hypothetical protein